MKNNLKRIVEFSPAYDKRDPDPSKNYGIHGMEIRFVLKGSKGAVQFLVFTNWFLPHVQKELYKKGEISTALKYGDIEPMGADIGYHSPIPQYEGQTIISDSCPYLDGRPCYYDGSGLRAQGFVPKFLGGGDKTVWEMLAEEYNDQFGELPSAKVSEED